MKHLLIFLVGIYICNLVSAQNTIGDVKYSILEPSKFMELNPGWILMDGGASKITDSIYKDSPLWRKYSIPFPDARGLFIRGMNEKRDTSQGDADGDSSIGRYQGDDFKKHSHELRNHNLRKDNLANGRPNWDGGAEISTLQGMNRYPIENLLEILPNGGKESRPRNIALYIYIKVK